MNNIIHEFKNTIQKNGLIPPAVIEPGIFYRFPGIGKSPSNKAAYCKLFSDCNGGIFGDYSTGLKQTWFTDNKQEIKHITISKTNTINIEQQQEKAALQAQNKWRNAIPANPKHPYLINKKVRSYNLRQHKNALVIPIMDKYDNITSLQFIYPDSIKTFFPKGKIKGCYSFIGDVTPVMHLCEGWATGATIHQATNCGVIVAMSAGNLEPVAEWALEKYTHSSIFVCADNDGSGIANALSASKVLNKRTEPIIPQFIQSQSKANDFNDLMLLEGLPVVKKQIVNATSHMLEFIENT